MRTDGKFGLLVLILGCCLAIGCMPDVEMPSDPAARSRPGPTKSTTTPDSEDPPAESDDNADPPANPDNATCEPIETRTMLRSMVNDLSRIDLDVRRFIRYFSLAHFQNAGVCGATLDVQRYALGKAVNALSLGTQIVAPQPIDEFNTLFRIDLRDYGWDAPSAGSMQRDKWEELVQANPYAFEMLQDDAEIIKLFTDSKVPFMNGDWFVNAATQPPLYHQMLDLPTTLTALQQQLGVNIASDISRERVLRSGFLDSNISKQNRIIEHHQIPVAASRSFWISYDFAGNGGRENIFAHPLDFQPDGFEIIFSLPNGLHAYMIANAAGARLDTAPTAIVVDPQQADFSVHNGISCIGCHTRGMRQKNDELRDYVADSLNFDAATKDTVQALYPTHEEFTQQLNGDIENFEGALQHLDPPSSVDGEPIIAAFREFEQNVGLDRAAAEFGMTSRALLIELGRLSPELAPLASGSIKRATLKAKFAESVCLLKLGIANHPACADGS